ncbi:hypothetical protein K788_0001804 (plasmid) [Paraburkholderia caribensis MBA4]|uniref:Uncharacterized protein n=1 Tax=Paraburkholderia caribensis MBA4 TaxID=1323664 RepID=A0A0P0RQT9_9BURK|nr:hypothetical protein K788_0001804 [Paraburkholderia caribensis MBA4]
MNRSKYEKESRCGASRSDGGDLTEDVGCNHGFVIRDENYGQVVS